MKWIRNKLSESYEGCVQVTGKSFVYFIIEKDGSINVSEIAKSSGDSVLDREAVRIIQSLPSWKPGNYKGKPVRIQFILPVNFSIY